LNHGRSYPRPDYPENKRRKKTFGGFTPAAAGKKKKVELIAHRLPTISQLLGPQATNRSGQANKANM
jgi:hypothetical protein